MQNRLINQVSFDVVAFLKIYNISPVTFAKVVFYGFSWSK